MLISGKTAAVIRIFCRATDQLTRAGVTGENRRQVKGEINPKDGNPSPAGGRAVNALNGLVLAGGFSTRMGRDKGLLVYNGAPQREFMFDLLMNACHDVYTSCRKEQQVPDRLHPLFDRYEMRGPLNGILSAFDHHPSAAWLAVAVDMPFITRAVLERLIRQRDPGKLATCFFNPGTRLPEPLLTLWEPHARIPLAAFAAKGNHSPREFLNTHPVKTIHPPDARILRNINYPGESMMP